MAENRKHINIYAEKLVKVPKCDDLYAGDVIDAWADGAEWMLKRAEKRRIKETIKLRKIITKLQLENNHLKEKLGMDKPKRKKKVNLYTQLKAMGDF